MMIIRRTYVVYLLVATVTSLSPHSLEIKISNYVKTKKVPHPWKLILDKSPYSLHLKIFLSKKYEPEGREQIGLCISLPVLFVRFLEVLKIMKFRIFYPTPAARVKTGSQCPVLMRVNHVT